MSKDEMILHNEHLAIQKVRREYQKNGIVSAMKLCQTFTGQSVKDAYQTVQDWCEELKGSAV
jgi:hypothetical protein